MANTQSEFYFQWHFTDNCNLRCLHCYQNSYKSHNLSNKDLIRIAVNVDNTLKKWGKKGRISLTGGEPLLNADILFDILKFFDNSDNICWTGILSNGTLLDEKILSTIASYNKLKEVQVSIDGANQSVHDSIRGKGSFNKALEGIRGLKRNRVFTSIMFTLHRQNKDECIPVIELAAELGVDSVTIERITPMSLQDKKKFYIDADELRNIYHKIFYKKKQVEKNSGLKVRVSRPLWTLVDEKIGGFCPAGLTSLCILHDGTVLPCRRLQIPIGNILIDGLYKIWYMSDVLWQLRNKDKLRGKCKECKYINSCGGCRAIAYAVNGHFMDEDPQCWKEIFDK